MYRPVAGDRVLGDEVLVALQIEFCIRQQRPVAAQVPLRLVEGRLVRTRVDQGDGVALFDELSLLEEDLLQCAADLRLHGHGGRAE